MPVKVPVILITQALSSVVCFSACIPWPKSCPSAGTPIVSISMHDMFGQSDRESEMYAC